MCAKKNGMECMYDTYGMDDTCSEEVKLPNRSRQIIDVIGIMFGQGDIIIRV